MQKTLLFTFALSAAVLTSATPHQANPPQATRGPATEAQQDDVARQRRLAIMALDAGKTGGHREKVFGELLGK
ncbi:MAG: hypothetical protein ACI89X_003362 [Planctomycetota bacterium]|jgi:hypothetical protein